MHNDKINEESEHSSDEREKEAKVVKPIAPKKEHPRLSHQVNSNINQQLEVSASNKTPINLGGSSECSSIEKKFSNEASQIDN